MRNLNKKDCIHFLENGELTKPFLESKYIMSKVMIDYNHKVKLNQNYTKLESLYNWIHHCIKSMQDSKLKNELKFQRTAQEIWGSGFCTGCTDWAILFSTFARQIDIPTTLLHTAEYNWIKALKNNENQPIHIGHSFCECFYDNKWILVDPTFRKIEKDYNSEKLVLSYQVSNSNIYIPYFRGLDLGKKQSLKEHNNEMDEICSSLEI